MDIMGGPFSADSTTNVQYLRQASGEAPADGKALCFIDEVGYKKHKRDLAESGWEIAAASDLDAVEAVLRRDPEFLVGLAFVSRENCGVIEELVSLHDKLQWIAIVDKSDLRSDYVRHVIAYLFFDYHTLPIDIGRLRVVLGHARGMGRLRNVSSEDTRGTEAAFVHDMIGMSKGMRALYTKIEKVAPTDFPVLITGESGTGKELVAEAIHRQSRRSDKPFVVVNCGAIVPTLIQSELFGHERGSFTSADKRRAGHFETANGGTIFLDEIAELPMETQATLLRVLEEKLIRRVGSSDNLPTDIRVIAATNRKLTEAVAAGKFREDLLYRLNVVHVEVPALRERQEDIEKLASYYLNRVASELKLKTNGFARNAIAAMLDHAWPGNVRELINRINNAALLCDNRLIHARDLGLDSSNFNFDSEKESTLSLKQIKEQAEHDALAKTLKRVNFNVSVAARRLGISRVTLYNLLKKHGFRE